MTCRFVLEKRLRYRITTENGKFLITQREPAVIHFKTISVNHTVPKSQQFSFFFAEKDRKRSDFFNGTARSAVI
jgi:hypothetical protein